MPHALVIGGCGFLGQNLVSELLSANFKVSVFDFTDANPFPDTVTFTKGDIRDETAVAAALKGVDVVVHCASPNPLSSNRKLLMSVNLDGTRAVINAMHCAGVHRLVLTSSASVVFEGHDISNGDESLPYARTYPNDYTESKVLQEKLALAANGERDLRVVALRPHGIFGPKDRLTLPSIAEKASQGKLRYYIGSGKNLVDWTYVRNVAYAHVLAAQKLLDDTAAQQISGKAYFITNDEPMTFWGFMGRVAEGLGFPGPSLGLPAGLMYGVAYVMVFVSWVLGLCGISFAPSITPYQLSLAVKDHYFSCARAKEDLGYQPLVAMDEAIRITLEDYEQSHGSK